MLRCQQCELAPTCKRYQDYLNSERPADQIMFECPEFDPQPCHVIPEHVRADVEKALSAKLTCLQCCHCASTNTWERPLCGEKGPVGFESICESFALREDELPDYHISLG